tara:strand:+ start:172 stop:462 length:291 start_codon:yes stop_codon:yes gene_type:complete
MKPLVYTEDNKFIMMIKNVDDFLSTLQDNKSNLLEYEGILFDFIPELDDLGLHEVCHVTITEERNSWEYLCKTNIEISGDNGIVYLTIINNPTYYG